MAIVKVNDIGPLKPGRVIDFNEQTMRYFDPTLRLGVIQNVQGDTAARRRLDAWIRSKRGAADVCFGSLADSASRPANARFTPESRPADHCSARDLIARRRRASSRRCETASPVYSPCFRAFWLASMLVPKQRRLNAAFDPYWQQPWGSDGRGFHSKVFRVWSRGCRSSSSRKPIAIQLGQRG